MTVFFIDPPRCASWNVVTGMLFTVFALPERESGECMFLTASRFMEYVPTLAESSSKPDSRLGIGHKSVSVVLDCYCNLDWLERSRQILIWLTISLKGGHGRKSSQQSRRLRL